MGHYIKLFSERNRESLKSLRGIKASFTHINIDLETVIVRYWKVIQELRQIYQQGVLVTLPAAGVHRFLSYHDSISPSACTCGCALACARLKLCFLLAFTSAWPMLLHKLSLHIRIYLLSGYLSAFLLLSTNWLFHGSSTSWPQDRVSYFSSQFGEKIRTQIPREPLAKPGCSGLSYPPHKIWPRCQGHVEKMT